MLLLSDNNLYVYIFRLWVHEILRVFYDRLIDIEDRTWLFHTLKLTVKEHFKETFDYVMDKLEPDQDAKEVNN